MSIPSPEQCTNETVKFTNHNVDGIHRHNCTFHVELIIKF